MFGRALRLRWLWYEWIDPNRPWAGTMLPCDAGDRQLFRASTVLTIGDGRKAKFWQSSWLNGMAPMDIAPNLYKLAWRKNLTVRKELQDDNWMRGLWRMRDADTIYEFVKLWGLVQQVQLNEQQDTIVWRWTSSGQYTTRSAYMMQCQGSYSTFDTGGVWRAATEGKHKIFAWLALQNKVLTADRLADRNWDCNQICPLSDQENETISHLALHCCYSKQVWQCVNIWKQQTIFNTPDPSKNLEEWWNESLMRISKKEKQIKAATLIHTIWSIWKERNRRIFEHREMTPQQVFRLIKEEIKLREMAYGHSQAE